ncbi:MAG: CoA ester lyase [Burkholderiaceae bacterium]|nr:CoA ester lyase [Burkholderiaceae bacterium]
MSVQQREVAARLRTLLFVPVLEPRFFAKAGQRGADALILDLEDAVVPERKAEAREALVAAAATLRAGGVPVLARVNNDPATIEHDLKACVAAGVDMVMLPKAESAEQVRFVAERLGPGVGLAPLIESPRGVLRAEAIVGAHDAVVATGFGAEDFALAMGAAPSRALLGPPASHVAMCAHAHGVACWGLVTGIVELADREALREIGLQARQLGFTGTPAIHPNQVPVFNEAFSPSEQEIAHSRRVLEVFEAARACGAGTTRLDGKLVDKPIVDRALRILESHARRG